MIRDSLEPRQENDPQEKGYVRLKFFEIKLWQIVILTLLIIGLTLIVFPRDEKLISFYLDKGMPDKALSVLAEMLKNAPDDLKLLTLSADIYEKKNDPGGVIEILEGIVGIYPRNLSVLSRLADYYERYRHPRQAVAVWEKIVAADPENISALRRLSHYYHYYGPDEKKAGIILRLVSIEKDQPPEFVFSDIPSQSLREWIINDPFIRAITREINHIADAASSEANDRVICALYTLRMNYASTMRRHPPNLDDAVMACSDLYVKNGMLGRAKAFATYLDHERAVGFRHRLGLVRVMRQHQFNKAAISLLWEINEQHPQNVDILLKIGEVALETENIPTAIAAHEKLLQIQPDMENKLKLASLYLASENPRKAYLLHRDIIENAQNKADYLDELLRISAYTGDSSLMTEALELAMEVRPDDADILRRAAKIYLWANQPEDAYSIYKQLALASKAKPDVDKMLETAGFTGHPSRIREAAFVAKKLLPRDAGTQLKVAEVLLSAGEQRAAIGAYADYLRLRPGDAEVRKQLAQLFLQVNQPRKAYGIWKQLALKGSGRCEDMARLTEIAGFTGEPKIIREAVLLAREHCPKNAALQLRAAELLASEEKRDAAIRAYEDYLALRPADEKARHQLARLYLWNNHPEKASALFGQISDKDPTDFQKALEAGNAFVNAEKLEKGIAYFERASRIRPDDTDIRQKLVTYYRWSGLREKMIAELEYLDALGHVRGEDRTILAQVYLDRGEVRKALRHLRHHEEQDRLPRQEGMMLARAYELVGKADASIRIYKRLAKENAKDPELLAELGNYALWLRYLDVASTFFEAALKRDSRNLTALKGSAQIFAWNNNPEKAMRRFEKYNKLFPNDYSARYQLGELYFISDREGDAFREYRKTLTLIKKAREVRSEK